MGPDGKYGYGFGDFRVGGTRQFGHSGGAPGINASLRIYPELGCVAVVMSNYDPPAATLVAAWIACIGVSPASTRYWISAAFGGWP